MADSSSTTFPQGGDGPGPVSGVRFGVFEVDFEAAELRKRGLRVRLQEQPFRVLSLLLEQPGRVVSREELQSKLWAGDTFVDFDHGLNTAINKLRQALGDSASNPRFIETMHRRGYRFIAPVERLGVDPGAGAPATEPPPATGAAQTVDSPAPPAATPADPPSPQTTAASAADSDDGSASDAAAVAHGPGTSEPANQSPPLSDELAPLRPWLRLGGMVVFSVTVAFGIYLLATVIGFVERRLERADGEPERITPALLNQARILAGQSNDYVSPSEQVWTADRFFVGGSTARRSGVVVGTDDANLFQGERYGSFQYVIPVMPGKYRLTLYFAETWFGPGNQGGGGVGSRVFDVECNGRYLLRRLDIYREARGANRALVRTFDNIEPTEQGHVVITFLPHANNGMINALELTPMSERNSSDRTPTVPQIPQTPNAE